MHVIRVWCGDDTYLVEGNAEVLHAHAGQVSAVGAELVVVIALGHVLQLLLARLLLGCAH